MKPSLYIFLLFALWFSRTQAEDSNFLGFPKTEDIDIPVGVEPETQNQIVEGNGGEGQTTTEVPDETPVVVAQPEEQETTAKEEGTQAEPEKEDVGNSNGEEAKEESQEVTTPQETQAAEEKPQETQQETSGNDEEEETGEDAEGSCEPESPEEIFQILTPEQQAYKDHLYSIPEPPEGYNQIKMGMIRKDKSIMKAYSFSIPSFLLKGISLHHKFVKSQSKEERESLLHKGFLMPGPYKLDLVYMWRKQIDEGYIYRFGVVVNRCLERECVKRPYPCKNIAHFASFEPLPSGKRQFLDWGVHMAPEGFMQCPNYIA